MRYLITNLLFGGLVIPCFSAFVSSKATFDGTRALQAVFSANEIGYLENGVHALAGFDGNAVYLFPLFSFQVCYEQTTDAPVTTTVTSGTLPSLVESGTSNTVPIALRVTGNNTGTNGASDLLFLNDTSKTVYIYNNDFSSGQINTTPTLTVQQYTGEKLATNANPTGNNQKLNHFTSGGIENYTHAISGPVAAATGAPEFRFHQTSYNNVCQTSGGVSGPVSGAVTMIIYADIMSLIENRAATYTLSADLTPKMVNE